MTEGRDQPRGYWPTYFLLSKLNISLDAASMGRSVLSTGGRKAPPVLLSPTSCAWVTVTCTVNSPAPRPSCRCQLVGQWFPTFF